MNKIDRVIFADYDGVLNDPQFLIDSHKIKPSITIDGYEKRTSLDDLDPHRIAILSNLCSRTKAKVVLTSTWRDDLKARKYLIKCGIPVIGATPHGKDRGQEIHQWILDKHFTGPYIILDDECSEFNESQLTRLVCTREGGNLGLSYKHSIFAESLFRNTAPSLANSTFIRAILLTIKEDLDRVYWNVYQKDYEDTPFQNTGNIEGFKTDVFEAHAYDWNWDYEDGPSPQPVNFKWRDLEITWYKWYGRGIGTNRSVTHDELALMLEECLESLRKWEEENE